MKKFLLMPLVAALMASCSNSATKQEAEEAPIDTSELIVVEETDSVESTDIITPIDTVSAEPKAQEEPTDTEMDDSAYSTPLKASFFKESGSWRRISGYFSLLKNGKMTGHMKYEELDYGKWTVKFDSDIFGKWSTIYFSRGEDRQKIYVIDRSDYSHSYYMPDDCEYIWYGEDAYYNCNNYNLDDTYDVTEVTKP